MKPQILPFHTRYLHEEDPADKEIYILDETTSNLDSLSENKIYDMINKDLKDKTCLIVTHRPKLTEICNKHYYFDKRVMLEK